MSAALAWFVEACILGACVHAQRIDAHRTYCGIPTAAPVAYLHGLAALRAQRRPCPICVTGGAA